MNKQRTFGGLAWKDKGKATRRERFLARWTPWSRGWRCWPWSSLTIPRPLAGASRLGLRQGALPRLGQESGPRLHLLRPREPVHGPLPTRRNEGDVSLVTAAPARGHRSGARPTPGARSAPGSWGAASWALRYW